MSRKQQQSFCQADPTSVGEIFAATDACGRAYFHNDNGHFEVINGFHVFVNDTIRCGTRWATLSANLIVRWSKMGEMEQCNGCSRIEALAEAALSKKVETAKVPPDTKDIQAPPCECLLGCTYPSEDGTPFCLFCREGPRACCCPCAGCDPTTDDEPGTASFALTLHLIHANTSAVASAASGAVMAPKKKAVLMPKEDFSVGDSWQGFTAKWEAWRQGHPVRASGWIGVYPVKSFITLALSNQNNKCGIVTQIAALIVISTGC